MSKLIENEDGTVNIEYSDRDFAPDDLLEAEAQRSVYAQLSDVRADILNKSFKACNLNPNTMVISVEDILQILSEHF